jgi:hypothetical protein
MVLVALLLFRPGALAGPSPLQLVLDVCQDSSLGFAPLRSEQEISRRFTEESLDRDWPGQIFQEIANATEVFGVPQGMIFAFLIAVCKGCALNYMTVVNLHALNWQAGEKPGGLHHLRMRLAWKAQDDVHAHKDRSVCGSFNGIEEVLHPVPAPDAIQRPVVGALQAVLHPDLVLAGEGLEQVKSRVVRAVRACAHGKAYDLAEPSDHTVTFLQEMHGTVSASVRLEIGEEAAGSISLFAEKNTLGQLLVQGRESWHRTTLWAEGGILAIDAARPLPVVGPFTMGTPEARVERNLVYPPAVPVVEIVTEAVIASSGRLACLRK